VTDEVETERVTMAWPKDLKDRVKEKNGPRGLTEFTVAALERHLLDADPIAESSEEVGNVRALCQLLADRVAMGGDDDDRRQALMELELPDWLVTTGWPTEMANLVKPPPLVDASSLAPENSEVQTPVQISEEVQGDAAAGERDDLFARMAKRTGQPLDPGFKDLQVASDLEVPEKPSGNVHNHAWERTDGILCCQCGAWIDDSDPAYPNGIVRDENWTPSITLTTDLNPPAPVVVEEPAKELCPTCQDELVAGECWNCA
jgi:hypothetical protein